MSKTFPEITDFNNIVHENKKADGMIFHRLHISQIQDLVFIHLFD